MTRPIWFKRKMYGWGWYPATWQGWAILGAYTGGLATLLFKVDPSSDTVSLTNFVLPLLGLTMILLLITYLTGEKPRWQWGDRHADSSQLGQDQEHHDS